MSRFTFKVRTAVERYFMHEGSSGKCTPPLSVIVEQIQITVLRIVGITPTLYECISEALIVSRFLSR